ncbi:unnamed protein product [Acanthoscelides obtectus]|uniref:Uncharacterized protein n=1 Tax=Acanthoscelides obtectus TaxID=200917 RepID=A0A9P0KBV5_ACAOB|nr:unnamed protein product [Acanthoscelides obtectus]CAK1640972.1 hypothetical protein AOBTE_LOCUS12049 [Acanthoscelides obtectus]
MEWENFELLLSYQDLSYAAGCYCVAYKGDIFSKYSVLPNWILGWCLINTFAAAGSYESQREMFAGAADSYQSQGTILQVT